MKLKGQARKIDELHLEYEALLVAEIENLIGLAVTHGWKSSLYPAGKMARRKLKDAGSALELPECEQ